ncbi:spherulin-1A [Plectosphaerella cucumerina]|uniref:Spherulin-1A n=1 Tax=Plectosphaerella cucumerina TaxID=40658 RepID=A0A8K0X5G5_9PEZI|nr:spherulin-1A [Plectosphaerella cucumerina]
MNTLFALSLLATSVMATDVARDPELVADIKTAPSALDALKLVQDNFTFDFTTHEYYSYEPGGVVNANAATWPTVTNQGLTMAWLALGPCAMLPPHYHPRATNFVVAVEGETKTWMIQENGADVVETVLTPGKMTIFPQGSLHSMQNTGCGNATLISALNSEDAGTHNVLTGLFKLPNDIVQAAFGGADVSGLGGGVPHVATGANIGSAECLARCQSQGRL